MELKRKYWIWILLFCLSWIYSITQCARAAIAFDTTQNGGTPAGSTGTSYTVTFTNNSNPEVIVAYIVTSTTTSSIINGTATNITWSNISNHTMPITGWQMAVFQGKCTGTNSAKTFTVNLGSTGVSACVADIYSGEDVTSPIEATNYTNFSGSTGNIAGSVTTITGNALVVSAIGNNTVGPITAGSGFTQTSNHANPIGTLLANFAERGNTVTTSPSTVNCNWAASTTVVSGSIVGVSIKPVTTSKPPFCFPG